MGNPLINRWGSNIFWPNLWYSDKNYSNNVKQDHLLIKLIKLYFFFGIQLPKHLFISPYWYYTLKPLIKNFRTQITTKYYRSYSKKVSRDGERSKYKVRNAIKDIFPMKIWIFKFSNWLIVNFYWFQPVKKSARRITKKRPKSMIF